MKKFEVLPLQVGQLNSNCYIYKISDSKAIIIDPGDDGDYIIQKLLDNSLSPLAIIVTHGHFDHIMAGFTLQASFNCPVYINKKDEFLVNRMRETAIHFGEVDPGPPPIATFISEKTKLHIPDIDLEIIQTPGHTPGSICIYDKGRSIVFIGDLMFADGSIGEVTHRYSSRVEIRHSIKKILDLPGETIIYPGHGESASIEDIMTNFEWVLGK